MTVVDFYEAAMTVSKSSKIHNIWWYELTPNEMIENEKYVETR